MAWETGGRVRVQHRTGADRNLAVFLIDVETGRVAVTFVGSVRVSIIVIGHPRWRWLSLSGSRNE